MSYRLLFRDSRLLFVLLIGFCSGFPWAVTGSLMTQFLVEQELSRSAIGIFGSIAIVYACNFLWAPVVDSTCFRISANRRSDWLIVCLLLQIVATCLLAANLLTTSIWWIAFLVFCIACGSATQDVAIDAWRIELINTNEGQHISMAATAATIGWWSGYSIPAAIFFYMTDFGWLDWREVYYAVACIYALLAAITWRLSYHPRFNLGHEYRPTVSCEFTMYRIFIVPLTRFAQNYGVLTVGLLIFIFSFKLGEAFLGRMSITFYNQIGFSKSTIATHSKLIGWGTTIGFSLMAGLVMVKFGLIWGLLISGVAMASTNLMFSWIALVGPNERLLFWTIVCDNFTGAFATIAFVAFLSYLCNRENTATEYAVLASIGNFGRTSLSGLSGVLVDALDGNWAIFFIITALMALPSLVLLVWIAPKIRALKCCPTE